MRAVTCRRYGTLDDLELVELPRPAPRPGQVLVAVKAASVNDWDLGIVRGSPWFMRLGYGLTRPGRVPVLGCDVAGTVVAVGDGVERWRLGDEVFGDLCRSGFGAFADFVCAPVRSLVRKPASMSFAQAAGLPQAGALCLQALGDLAALGSGQRLVINGAGGGVGTLAIQLLRRRGLEVTAVDSAGKLDRLRALGADRVLDYGQVDFTATGDAYDLIVDVHSDRAPADYARALAPGGRYVTVGGSMWRMLQILQRRRRLERRDGKRLRIVSLIPNRGLEALAERFIAGEFQPVLEAPFPIARFRDAIELFASAGQFGKVLLTFD